MRASSNPVLTSLEKPQNRQQAGGYDNYGQVQQERAMTVDDVISKTGITLGVIIVMAIINFAIGVSSASTAMLLTMVGAIGGLITVLVASFGKKFGSKGITLTYAAFEGLFVGGFSFMFSDMSIGDENGKVIIGQAIVGTIGVFLGMLWVYKSGTIRMTPKLNRFITAAICGVAVLMLVNLVLYLFGIDMGLRSGGPLAIIFSLFCIGLAAMSFLQDFDVADNLIRQNAPERMAWGVAMGLAVTLVWLYTEILRLLSYFQQR
ncbi:MAG: Bax inhibitor-1/YccA family protein [Corynebacterium sp.]|nr:Bax inhibitor-1/YccA family protein [Corynebacterium sp.]